MAFSIDLTDKVVLITGVSSGIGLGTVRQFALAGAKIIGCSRKPDGHEKVMRFYETAHEAGAEAFYVQADVTRENDLQHLVEAGINHFGKLDILVSNAGENVFEGVSGCSEERWNYNMNLNLSSHWRLCKLCRQYLEKSEDGVIILMTSNHAFYTIPGCFPYNLAKTAITALVQSLTIEWGPNVRSVGVAPGFIDTPGNDTWFNSFPDPAAERQRTIDLHPVKKLGTVDEVGALCVFLASPYARFISGTTVLMDGGRSALMQDS